MEWIYKHWGKLWGLLAIGSLVAIWVAFEGDLTNHPTWYAWLLLPAAWAHEFEEYGVGNFWRWYNRTCFKSNEDYFPLTHERAFWINVLASLPPLILQAIIAPTFIYLTLFLLITVHANAWFHIGYTVGEGKYSPGAVTSLLIYIPLTTIATVEIINSGRATTVGFLITFILSVAAGWGLFSYLRNVAQSEPERLVSTARA